MMSEVRTLRDGIAAGHSRVQLACALPGRTPEAISTKSRELRGYRLRPRELDEPSAPFSFHLPHVDHGWLTRLARQKKTTRSELMRRIVTAARSGALPF